MCKELPGCKPLCCTPKNHIVINPSYMLIKLEKEKKKKIWGKYHKKMNSEELKSGIKILKISG